MALLNAIVLQDDTDMAYAETWNQMYHSMHGNQVISGCGVTEQTIPDLTVAIASGSVLVGGAIKTVTGSNMDLSTESAALTTGQAQFVYIYIDSAGAIQKLAGTAATAGQQYPPAYSSLPDDCVVLARILLTQGDSAINTADIHEMRQYVPSGIYTTGRISSIANNAGIYTGAGSEMQLYFDGTNSILNHTPSNSGNLILYSGGVPRIYLPYNGNMTVDNVGVILNKITSYYSIADNTDSDVELFKLDVAARTLQVGQSADSIPYTNYGDITVIGSGNTFAKVKSTDATYGSESFMFQVTSNNMVEFQLRLNDDKAGVVKFYNTLNQFLGVNTSNYIDVISRFAADLLPSVTGGNNLGSATYIWNNLYANILNIGSDTNLYRSAANILKTDDDFETAGYLKAPTIGMRIQNWASGNNPPTINSTINATNDGSSRTIEAPANVRYVVSATLKISYPGYAGDNGTASGYLKYYNSTGGWSILGTVSISYGTFSSSDQLAISTNVIGQTIGGTGKYRLELVITTGTPTANITVELLSGATLQIEGVIQSV